MILATHNSLSYLKPQWWLRPFSWVGRCQSLTIEQQLEYGVRYFDIRLKFNEGNWIAKSGHGLLTYDFTFYSTFDLIDRHSSCIVRMTLENKKASGDMKDTFRIYCKECQSIFANTTFVG